MKQNNFTESPIDHYIQRDVLRRLFKDTQPVSFSELKPDDVDNSLFMYHIRKLTARGLIEKSIEGYRLTPDGARRINFVSTDTLKPDLYPRALISFIVLDEAKTSILLSQRISSAAGHVGAYVVPAGRMRYGVPLAQTMQERAQSLFGGKIIAQSLGIYETIITSNDGYIHHTVSFAYETTLDQTQEFPIEEHYALRWVSIDDAAGGVYGDVVQAIVRRYSEAHEFGQSTFAIQL